jgi:MFS family permease
MEWVRGAFLIVFLPAYATERLGISLSWVGYAVSVHYLADCIVKFGAGYLLDRYPVKRTLHAALLLSVAGMCMMLVAHMPLMLLAAACLIGIGGSPVWLLCLRQVEEDKRATQMGMLYVFWMAGAGSGPVLLNFFLDFGYAYAFAVMMVLIAFGWWFSSGAAPAAKVPVHSPIPLREQLLPLWKGLHAARWLLPGMWIQTLAGSMLVPFVSAYATRHLMLSHSQFSAAMLIGGALAIAMLIPMGKLADAWGGKWFLVCGFVLFSGSLIVLPHAKTFEGTAAIAGLLGMTYGSLLPAWNALRARYIPNELKSTGWGLFSAIEGSGIIIGPLIGGFLESGGHESLPFLTSAALFGLIGLSYLLWPAAAFKTRAESAIADSPVLVSEQPNRSYTITEL